MNIRECLLRIRQWYLDHFVPYVTIQQNNEHFFVSRQLWHVIDSDLSTEEKSDIRIFFKYVSDGGYFLMIVNPDMRAEFDDGVISEKAFDKQKRNQEHRRKMASQPRSKQIIEEVKRANEIMRSGKSKDDDESFPQTFPLQVNILGHVGFQGTQPSPAMIVYKYALDDKVERKYKCSIGFTDRLPLRVVPIIYRPEVYGTRHAFIITDEVLHRPTKTFSKPMKRR